MASAVNRSADCGAALEVKAGDKHRGLLMLEGDSLAGGALDPKAAYAGIDTGGQAG